MAKGKTLKIFTGNANTQLAECIAKCIGQPLGAVTVSRFPDGEAYVRYEEDIRGCHVAIIQPTNQPEFNLKELKLMAYVARSSSAAFVTAVIPYFGYGRQDRKDQPRVGITARMVADELVEAGIQHILVLDLHSAQIQGFFDPKRCIVEYLYGKPVFISLFQHLGLTDVVNGPPDLGRAKTAESYAQRLGSGMYFAIKTRRPGGHAEEVKIIGDVQGKKTRIIDDEISTGKTIALAADALHAAGAVSIDVVASHGKFVGDAPTLLTASIINKFYVGDSVVLPQRAHDLLGERLCRVTFAPLLGEAIKRLHHDESLSALFQSDFVGKIYKGAYCIEETLYNHCDTNKQ